MSVGVFESGKYEQATGTNIWPCKAQPESKELTLNSVANDYPAAAVTAGLPRIKLRKGRREVGLPIRTVTVRLTANGTAATAGYLSGTLHTVPVFSKAAYAAYGEGQTGTYLGIACEYVNSTNGD
jgi:hypothetical protein